MRIVNIGNRIVNNYLIETPKGWLVIDTGYPGQYERFRKKLASEGISPQEVAYVFVTHAHDDHVGFLTELMQATRAKLILHRDAPERLLAGHNRYKGGCSTRLAQWFVNSMALFGVGKHEFPVYAVGPEVVRWDGVRQFFREEGLELDMVALPGHTGDHIGLLAGDKFFCGDAAMNGFPSTHRHIIWIEDLGDYRRSWEVMIGSPAVMLYPSHGKPFPKADLVRFRPSLSRLTLRKVRLSQE